jgi:hypothetical protein
LEPLTGQTHQRGNIADPAIDSVLSLTECRPEEALSSDGPIPRAQTSSVAMTTSGCQVNCNLIAVLSAKVAHPNPRRKLASFAVVSRQKPLRIPSSGKKGNSRLIFLGEPQCHNQKRTSKSSTARRSLFPKKTPYCGSARFECTSSGLK